MHNAKRKNHCEEDSGGSHSINNVPWDDRSRHDMVFEERYGQKEKKQFKLMIPVSRIINFISMRLFG